MVREMKLHFKNILGVMLVLAGLFISNKTVYAVQMHSPEAAVINIKSYELEEGVLTPGEHVTINLTLINNSENVNAENVVLTLESAQYALLPVYGEDNQVYIGSIEAGKTKDVTVNATVNSMYNADMAQLRCQFDYISGNTPLNNVTAIYIPTYAAGNLVAESTIVSGSATVGVRSLVSVKYKNTSSADITSAQLILEGAIADDNKEISLPIVAAGKTYTEDYYVTFTEAGIQNLSVQYRYSDSQGNTYTTECGEYQVNVTNYVSHDSGVIVDQEEEGLSAFVKLILVVMAMGMGIATIIMYMKKN